MKIARCGQCGAKFDVSKMAPGVKIRCGRCKEVFVVPDPAAAPADPKIAAAAAARPAEKPAARPDRGTSVRKRPEGGTSIRPRPAEPAPAAEERGGRGTSVRPRPASTAATRAAQADGAGRGTSVRARPSSQAPQDEAATRPGRRSTAGGRAAAAKKRQIVLLAAGGGLLAVAGLVFYLVLGKNPSGETSATSSSPAGIGETASPYAALKAKTDMKNSGSVLQLAHFCDVNAMPKECDQHLLEAYQLDPANPDVKAKFQQVYAARREHLARDDAGGHWELVLLLDRFGMKEEADKLADFIVKKVNKNHPEANKRFDRVLFEGKWEERDLVETYQETRKALTDETELTAKMSPRERAVHKTVQLMKKSAMEFEYLDLGSDRMPYLIFVQKSTRYAAESALAEFSEVLGHLYQLFYRQYGERFDLTGLEEEVFVVWVYDSQQTYMTQGGPMIARGHYSPMDHQVKTYNEPEGRYEVVFHEGVHQLVHRITLKKGGRDGNMFWFTEGIATYFETFRRDQNMNFVLGAVASGSWLPNIKAAVREKKHVPLEDFVSFIYGQAMSFPPEQIGGLLYPEAWSFVHFLYNFDGGKYRDKFEEYFKAECSGQGGKEKFKEIFGDIASVESEWQGYVLALQ